MGKHVLAAPGVDKPEASVRESLDGALCHLLHFLEIALKLCPKTPCSGFSTAKLKLYPAEG